MHGRYKLQDLSEGQIKTLDLDEPVGHLLQYLKVVGPTVTTNEEHLGNDNDDDSSSSGVPNSSLTGSSNNAIGSSSSAAPGCGDNFSNLVTTATFTRTQNTATGGIVNANPAARTRAPITIMGLSGKDLYRCGMIGECHFSLKRRALNCLQRI